MNALGKLTPHQRATALSVLRKLAPPLSGAVDGPVSERYAVARVKVRVPHPYTNGRTRPAGVGVHVYEVGSAGALNRLRMKGYLEELVRTDGWATEQTFYAPTLEGLAWFRRAQAREIAKREEAPMSL